MGLALGRLPPPLRRRWARPVVRRFSRALTAVDARLVRAGRRSIGGTVAGAPVLLLHTTGCRTGAPRCTPLVHLRDDDGCWLVAAANGAADWEPAWLSNLRAHPAVEVEHGGRRVPARAEELDGDARAGAWSALVAADPVLDETQARCRRRIAVVRIRPSLPVSGP